MGNQSHFEFSPSGKPTPGQEQVQPLTESLTPPAHVAAETIRCGQEMVELLNTIHRLDEAIQHTDRDAQRELREAREAAHARFYVLSDNHVKQFGVDAARELEAWAINEHRRLHGIPSPPAADAPLTESQPSPFVGSHLRQGTNEGGLMHTDTQTNQQQPVARPSRTREEKHADIEQMTDQALADLGDALAAGKSERLTQYLSVMAKFHHYSFGNVLLIMIQRPDATHVAGFHKWKELGRCVKKGEHGIMILAPVTRKVGELEERRPDGKVETREVRRIVNVKPVYVFDVSQTDGKDLPAFAKANGDPATHTPKLKAFLASKNIRLEYADSLGGALGCSEGGKISCLNGLTPADEFHTLVHEVAHELLHRGERRNQTTTRTRELEAEAVAFVVCTAVGLNAKEFATDYIHLYQGSKEKLAESLQFIRTVANDILAALTPNEPEPAGS